MIKNKKSALEKNYEKARNAALKWHFGVITDPPLDETGMIYLTQVLPKLYKLVDGQLVYDSKMVEFSC